MEIIETVVKPKDPKKLTAAEGKILVDWLLSPEGFAAGLNHNKGGVCVYVQVMCKYSKVPYYQDSFVEMHKGLQQIIIGFPETGKKLTAPEVKKFKAHCQNLESFHNSCLFNLHGPTHSEYEVMITAPFEFGEPGNNKRHEKH